MCESRERNMRFCFFADFPFVPEDSGFAVRAGSSKNTGSNGVATYSVGELIVCAVVVVVVVVVAPFCCPSSCESEGALL